MHGWQICAVGSWVALLVAVVVLFWNRRKWKREVSILSDKLELLQKESDKLKQRCLHSQNNFSSSGMCQGHQQQPQFDQHHTIHENVQSMHGVNTYGSMSSVRQPGDHFRSQPTFSSQASSSEPQPGVVSFGTASPGSQQHIPAQNVQNQQQTISAQFVRQESMGPTHVSNIQHIRPEGRDVADV